MQHVDYFNRRCAHLVQHNIAGVNHNLAHALHTLIALEHIGVFEVLSSSSIKKLDNA